MNRGCGGDPDEREILPVQSIPATGCACYDVCTHDSARRSHERLARVANTARS